MLIYFFFLINFQKADTYLRIVLIFCSPSVDAFLRQITKYQKGPLQATRQVLLDFSQREAKEPKEEL